MATTTIQIDDGVVANDGTGTTLRAFAALFNAFNFSYGTYTPTLTAVSNVAALTPNECQFMRVGNVVTVSGTLSVDPTAGATFTEFGISLPIASNLASQWQLGGTGGALDVLAAITSSFAIAADATNNRATCVYLTGVDVANRAYSFHFTYQVI